MQLKDKKNAQIGACLALATSTLLSGAAAEGIDNWQTDVEGMAYQEGDGRVQALEPAINIRHTKDDGSGYALHLVYDSLTGSSPNGAARANVVQTFTSASGRSANSNGSGNVQTITGPSGATVTINANGEEVSESSSVYTINPGDLPLDSSFQDQRFMAALSIDNAVAEYTMFNYGGSFSTEQDFTSFSINAALTRDFNAKDTTVSLGTNLEFDSVKPIDGVPKSFGSYAVAEKDGSSDTKQVNDFMLGLTQVISQGWLMQFNLSTSRANGYLNDPYKILTVVTDGNLIYDPDVSQSYFYLYESRPDSRQKNSVFWQNKFALFGDDALDIDYRYMTDDWGIRSSTYDVTFHWQLSQNVFLEPHFRHYRQNQADFYTPFLSSGVDVINVTSSNVTLLRDYASADPRLAAFSADTIGVKLAYDFEAGAELSIRAEYYQQHDENRLKAVPEGSNLYGFSQFSELDASWIQLGYRYRW